MRSSFAIAERNSRLTSRRLSRQVGRIARPAPPNSELRSDRACTASTSGRASGRRTSSISGPGAPEKLARRRGVDRRSDAKVDEASAPGSAACEVRLHLTERGLSALQSPRKPKGLSHCIFECLIVEASSQAQNHLSVLADRYTERRRGVFDCTGDGQCDNFGSG